MWHGVCKYEMMSVSESCRALGWEKNTPGLSEQTVIQMDKRRPQFHRLQQTQLMQTRRTGGRRRRPRCHCRLEMSSYVSNCILVSIILPPLPCTHTYTHLWGINKSQVRCFALLYTSSILIYSDYPQSDWGEWQAILPFSPPVNLLHCVFTVRHTQLWAGVSLCACGCLYVTEYILHAGLTGLFFAFMGAWTTCCDQVTFGLDCSEDWNYSLQFRSLLDGNFCCPAAFPAQWLQKPSKK